MLPKREIPKQDFESRSGKQNEIVDIKGISTFWFVE